MLSREALLERSLQRRLRLRVASLGRRMARRVTG